MSLIVVLLPLPARQIPLPRILLSPESIRELFPLLQNPLLGRRSQTKSLVELDDFSSEIADLLFVKLLVSEGSVVELCEFLEVEFGFGEFLRGEERR